MRCLVNAFQEISNKSEEPFQTSKARTGVALLITGVILAILGAVATALFVAGFLSMLPSFVLFVFPSVALLGLIMLSVGAGLLIKRSRDMIPVQQGGIRGLVEQFEIISKELQDKVAQKEDPAAFSKLLEDVTTTEQKIKSRVAAYHKNCGSYTSIKALIETETTKLKSKQEIFLKSPNDLKNA